RFLLPRCYHSSLNQDARGESVVSRDPRFSLGIALPGAAEFFPIGLCIRRSPVRLRRVALTKRPLCYAATSLAPYPLRSSSIRRDRAPVRFDVQRASRFTSDTRRTSTSFTRRPVRAGSRDGPRRRGPTAGSSARYRVSCSPVNAFFLIRS